MIFAWVGSMRGIMAAAVAKGMLRITGRLAIRSGASCAPGRGVLEAGGGVGYELDSVFWTWVPGLQGVFTRPPIAGEDATLYRTPRRNLERGPRGRILRSDSGTKPTWNGSTMRSMLLPALLRVVLLASMAFGLAQPIAAADRTKGPQSGHQQTKEVIRDRQGKLLGEIRPIGSGRLEARDRSGKLLGRYDSKPNETRDAAGRLLTKGNTLSALIVKAAESKAK